jgi:hypothetical protein
MRLRTLLYSTLIPVIYGFGRLNTVDLRLRLSYSRPKNCYDRSGTEKTPTRLPPSLPTIPLFLTPRSALASAMTLHLASTTPPTRLNASLEHLQLLQRTHT